MILKKISEYNDSESICKLWNDEYGFIFPISKELFERNMQNSFDDASYVAIKKNKLIGFIVGKIWQDKYEVGNYNSCGWISLIFVHKKYRKNGIGTSLLKKAEEQFIKHNKEIIYVGRDYLNYFPGLPSDMKNSLEWFVKRGFEKSYCTYDLICKNKDIEPLNNKFYEFRTATILDKDKLITFMNNNWPGRWTKELIDYWNYGGTGREYLLGLDNEKIIAFAKINYPNTNENLISYSLTWRNRFLALGGIGPLGVDKTYRGRQIGRDIVVQAKNILLLNGTTDIIIDWTGLLDFYRPMGFEVWKSYNYLTKLIKKRRLKHEN